MENHSGHASGDAAKERNWIGLCRTSLLTVAVALIAALIAYWPEPETPKPVDGVSGTTGKAPGAASSDSKVICIVDPEAKPDAPDFLPGSTRIDIPSDCPPDTTQAFLAGGIGGGRK